MRFSSWKGEENRGRIVEIITGCSTISIKPPSSSVPKRRSGMLDLVTFIWGKETIEDYMEMALPSLLWTANIPSTQRSIGEYSIYASPGAYSAIHFSDLGRELEGLVKVNWRRLIKGEGETTSNLLNQLSRSLQRGNHIKICAPDEVVGNGSLLNLAQLCEGYSLIVYGFPRITEQGWEILRTRVKAGEILFNKDLVAFAMEHIEQETYPIIKRENEWLVSHNCPTPIVLPDKWMVDIFATNPTINSGFDHCLPYMLMEKGYPWKMIKHSETYFQVERGRHILREDYTSWGGTYPLMTKLFFERIQQVWSKV